MTGSILKLTLGGVVIGLLTAMTLGWASRPPRTLPLQPPAVHEPIILRPREDRLHCRAITMPETGCEEAWEAERHHFFGTGER